MKKILMVMLVLGLSGCVLSTRSSDAPIVTAAQLTEAVWIRNGEPLVFEGEDWFPTDETENLLDVEVYQAGVFRDVPFYIEKTDVRPFERIYTHFTKNRYRAFQL